MVEIASKCHICNVTSNSVAQISRGFVFPYFDMPLLSKEAKDRLEIVIEVTKKLFHVGYIPFVIYCGWQLGPDAGCGPFHLTHLLWHY